MEKEGNADINECFIEKITEITNLIAEKEKPAIEHRYKIMEAWRHIEECLMKTQGKERSNAYNTYKVYSLSETGMSTTFHKKLLGEMTERERSLLIIHK